MQLLRKLQKDEELHAKLAERYYLTAKTLLDLKSDINLLEDHYKPVAKFIALKDELKNSYIRQLLETKIWFEEAQDETKKHEIPYPPLDMKPWELMINYYYIWFDEIG